MSFSTPVIFGSPNNNAIFKIQELPFRDNGLADSQYIKELEDDQQMDPYDQCAVCSDITDFFRLAYLIPLAYPKSNQARSFSDI